MSPDSTDFAIEADCLSKAYRIGAQTERPDTFLGATARLLRSPIATMRHLRQLTRIDTDCSDIDVIWALRDVSFQLKHGEVLGIVGKNGAGKSTLLKILSRITEPTGGLLRYRGRVASLLEVGTGFHPELTGRENIFLNGTLLGMRKAEVERKLDTIVAFSGVERFLDTPLKRFSSGMKVRLAFAVASHLDPEILVVDEVLAVGDIAFQQQCLNRMQELARSGRTVLLVSHQTAHIRHLASAVLTLDCGRARYFDDVESGLRHYYEASKEGVVTPKASGLFPLDASLPVSITEAVLAVRSDSQLEVELCITINRHIPDWGLTLPISAQGIRIASVDTRRLVNSSLPREPGAYKLRFDIGISQLAAGSYTMTLGTNQQGQTIQRFEDVVQFTIDEQVPFRHQGTPSRGFFAPVFEIHIQPDLPI